MWKPPVRSGEACPGSVGLPSQRRSPTAPAHSLLAFAVFTTSLAAQGGVWNQLAPLPAPAPATRSAMVFEEHRNQALLFGGGSSGFYLADTWKWDGSTWTQALVSPAPSARFGHGMAYDRVRQRTVLFGGYGWLVGPLADTWEWDGTSWMQVSPINSPSARSGHTMAWDGARSRVLLFGGDIGRTVFTDETWEWDGSNWTHLSWATPRPPALSGHTMVADPQRNVVILHGGGPNSGGFHLDTWEWDGRQWRQVPVTTVPPGRYNAAMAFDRSRGRVVLFSGRLAPADTWEFDGNDWIARQPTSAPSGRFGSAAVFDSTRGRVILFGGQDNSGILLRNDTWEWNGGVTASAQVFGTGCGAPAPLTAAPLQNSRPIVGTTQVAHVSNVPFGFLFMAVGFSNGSVGPVPLPWDLTPVGATGCFAYHDAAATLTGWCTPIGPGLASFGLPIPSSSVLVGLRVYLQAWSQALGANPANLLTSNAIALVIGTP